MHGCKSLGGENHTLPQGSEYWNILFRRTLWKTHTLPQGSEYWNVAEDVGKIISAIHSRKGVSIEMMQLAKDGDVKAIHSRKGVSIEMSLSASAVKLRHHTLPQGSEYWNKLPCRSCAYRTYTPAREWVLKCSFCSLSLLLHTLPQGSEYWNESITKDPQWRTYTPAREWVLKCSII